MAKEKFLPKLKDQTPAYKLFHWPYMWMYAENEDFDENDTEYFGRLTTGNTEFDMKLATANSERYITTAKAAELAGRGVAMYLNNPKDSIVIYNLICEHLHKWHEHLSRPGSFGRYRDVPLAGLKEFNDLARNLAVVGRRHGLVEKMDPYEENRRRRAITLGYVPVLDLKSMNHSDQVYNEIAAMCRRNRKEKSQR